MRLMKQKHIPVLILARSSFMAAMTSVEQLNVLCIAIDNLAGSFSIRIMRTE